MRIAVTEVQHFKKCKRSWFYSYVDMLQSNTDNPAFWLGTGIHFCLENYYQQNTKSFDTLLKAWNKYIQANKKTGTWYDELITLGTNMLQTYYHFDLTQPTWNVLAVEEKIRIPIVRPRTGDEFLAGALTEQPTNEEKDVLTLVIDLVVQDDDGGIWIIDHKTASQIRTNEGLDLDYQMTAYVYGYWRKYGVLAKGVIYNTLLKQLRFPPEKLKNGEYSKNKTQKSTYEIYKYILERDGLSVEPYQEILEHLKSKSPAVVRHYSTRTIKELEVFEKFLFMEHQDMVKCAADFDSAYINPSTFVCTSCVFRPLCKETNIDGNVQFIKNFGYVKREIKEIEYDTTNE